MLPPNFRIRAAHLYLDESGQLRLPRSHEAGEVGVLAGICVPRTEYDRAAVESAAGELRRRVHGDPASVERVKGRLLGRADWDWLADEIRRQKDWLVGWWALPITQAEHDENQCTLRGFGDVIQKAKRKLGPSYRQPAANNFLDDLLCRYLQTVDRQPTYMALLFASFTKIAGHFRREGILPAIHTIMDERPEDLHEGAVDLLARLCVGIRWRELYEQRLGEVLGLDRSGLARSEFSTDDKTDGLILADCIAYAAGMIARGQDEDGSMQRFFDRLRWTRDNPPPDPV